MASWMDMTGRGGPPMPWLITPANGSPPDGLMCIVWVGQQPPPAPLSHEMRDECVLIWSSAPCTTLIIIFIDEYHCRQDDEVAICVRRLSQANTEQGLCHQREIWSCTDLRPMCLFQLAFLAHAHTISLSPDSLLWIYKIYVPIHATF